VISLNKRLKGVTVVDFALRMTDKDWADAEEEAGDEDLLWHYLWVVSEVYDVPLTNNYPRTQDGRDLRMVFDYMRDVREAFVRAGWRPLTTPPGYGLGPKVSRT
jgi:hypothetical protein